MIQLLLQEAVLLPRRTSEAEDTLPESASRLESNRIKSHPFSRPKSRVQSPVLKKARRWQRRTQKGGLGAERK